MQTFKQFFLEKKDYCYRKTKKKFKGSFPSRYAGAYIAKCRKKNK